jgi:hypothetical protein
MNISRSRIEDVLFVFALMIPALIAGARFVETDRQIEQIAQAQRPAAIVVVDSVSPAVAFNVWAEPLQPQRQITNRDSE